MSERLTAVKRIVKLQAQMKRLAEWKLLAAEQDLRAVQSARHDLDAFIEGPEPIGALSLAALSQMQRLARRQETMTAECSRRTATLNEAQRRLKRSETMADNLGRADREVDEKRTLEQIIEAATAQRLAADSDPGR